MSENGKSNIDSEDPFFKLELIPRERVVTKKLVQSRLHTANSPGMEEDLKNFALLTINNRIEFCRKYKTGEEEIGKCVCESVRRYIRLSKESRSGSISKKQINAIKKMFEEMKKEGKIKCQEIL